MALPNGIGPIADSPNRLTIENDDRLQSPKQLDGHRRMSLFRLSSSEAQENVENARRKSHVDTVSTYEDANEDLGFQWTPSVRLRVSKVELAECGQNESTLASATTEDQFQLTKAENGQPVSAALPDTPKRTMVDDGIGEQQREGNKSIYFTDGKRRIDYVLVYEQGAKQMTTRSGVHRRRANDREKVTLRQFYQENLLRDGLHLEEDVITHGAGADSQVTIYVKVHGTWSALCRQAEILKMKMPLRLRDTFAGSQSISRSGAQRRSAFRRFLTLLEAAYEAVARGKATFQDELINKLKEDCKERQSFVTWPFQSNKIDKYAIADQDTFFTPTQRMEMVWEIMQNARNDPTDKKKRGIEQLLELGVYESAFPLHDGPATIKRSKMSSQLCERQLLRLTWASWRCIFKKQPLALIRRYYGEKVGFYFGFLGFYTKMLVIPALVGTCAFLYGLTYGGDDKIVQDVCDKHKAPGNFTMCPICRPPSCEFTKLSDGCVNAQWDYRMDNEATLVMAVVTVIWATVFLKAWKRREAELAFEWDTYEVQQSDGAARPDYEERALSTRRNPVTREMEPYVPWSRRSRWLVWSVCLTLFMLGAVGVALACLVLARIALYGLFKSMGIQENVEMARWFVHGMIFLVVLLFDAIYSSLGRKATSLECPRTQAQWLSSFLWKLFIFELLNDFVPIGYAAWFKGVTVRTPLDLTWASELCDSGGCMAEVTELIAVLLLARLVVGNGAEIGVPFMKHVFARFAHRRKAMQAVVSHENTDIGTAGTNDRQRLQWRSDNLLSDLELDGVADEYMEMIVQFAFVTLFVPAFPVAPLVCLVNNIFEVRVDAIKFIVSHRRPLPTRVPGIQLWNEFLNIVAKLAVLCNGALISFTSGMIPRLYYKYAMRNGSNYNGFIEFTLSHLPATAWKHSNQTRIYEVFLSHNVTHCYYRHQRYSDEDRNFNVTQIWWEITSARLAAFCAFVTAAYAFQWLYNFLVSDVPPCVTLKMQRRRYVVSTAMEAEVLSEKWFKHVQHKDYSPSANREGKNGNALRPLDNIGPTPAARNGGCQRWLPT